LVALLGLSSAAGCGVAPDRASGDLMRDLAHPDPHVRLDAAVRASSDDQSELLPRILPRLIELLDDEDDAVRMMAGHSLCRLTGADLGFKPYGSLAERAEAIDRWRRWLQAKQPASEPQTTESAPPRTDAAAGEGRASGEVTTAEARR
jgi:hypothetical protein